MNILNHQTKRTGSAAVILAVSYLLSRFLGVVRDWLLAGRFGAGAQLDVYFTAFKIPDFVYNIFIAGGLVASFLPLFSEYFEKNRKEAWDFVSNALNTFLFFLSLCCLFLFVFIPQLAKFIAPGFGPGQISQTVFLTRLMLLSPIFFGLSSVFSGVLQYFNRFLIYSLCPIVYNLSIIAGIVFLSPYLGILGVVLGVVSGALLHFVMQIPSVSGCGFKYKRIFDFKDSRVRKMFMLMGPRVFGVSSLQFNAVFINAIASTLAVGSIAVFNFANNVRLFPISIIGVSFATAVFPKLSQYQARGDRKSFNKSFSSVFRQIVFLALPASLLMFALRNQIVEVILRHGAFSSESASLVSASIGLFCLGSLFATLRPLFFRTFFSLKDTRTPTILAVVFIIINIPLSLVLAKGIEASSFGALNAYLTDAFSLGSVSDISVLGFPLAYLAALSVEFVLFMLCIKKAVAGLELKGIIDSFLKAALASGIMLFIVYSLFPFVGALSNLCQLVIVPLAGLAAYFLLAHLLGSPETAAVKSLIFGRIFHRVYNHEEY